MNGCYCGHDDVGLKVERDCANGSIRLNGVTILASLELFKNCRVSPF
jgi:hypothetical protein